MPMPELPYVVEPMGLADVDQVMEIEQVAFTAPWSARAYRYEIAENENSVMLVVRPAVPQRGWLARILGRSVLASRETVLGYGGMWLLVDDAHIATLAVHSRWRGRGLGELLLLSLLDLSPGLGARRATLEVRVSNAVARELYQKYGFEVVSLRKRYYADNNEDAYIMSTLHFEAAKFQENLAHRRSRLYARLCAEGSDILDLVRSTTAG
jgi:ribosomal-protein-alanine N-acetyltransferase